MSDYSEIHGTLLTIGKARARLAGIWIFSLLPLIVLIIVQIVIGRYGSDWQTPWSWMSTLIFPIWGIILAVITVRAPKVHGEPIHSRFTYHIAIGLSVTYIAVLYVIALLGPMSPLGIKTVMANSGLYMGFFQAMVTAALGKFFLESFEGRQ
jgi:hypothetical protein